MQQPRLVAPGEILTFEFNVERMHLFDAERENMLEVDEVRFIAKEMASQSEIFSIMDESYISRIVVLQNNERFIDRLIPAYTETN